MEDVYASKPWLKSYDEHVPPTITNYPQMSCAKAMREAFDGVPDRMALNYMGTNISFRDFDTYSNQFAHFLISRGCRAGDVVGLHLLNVPAAFLRLSASIRPVAFLPASAYCFRPRTCSINSTTPALRFCSPSTSTLRQ